MVLKNSRPTESPPRMAAMSATGPRRSVKFWLAVSTTAIAMAAARSAAADDIMVTKAAPISAPASSAYDWSGFYAGTHLGVAWGTSNWTATPGGANGSISLYQGINTFDEAGS